jgi:hypothetical protein
MPVRLWQEVQALPRGTGRFGKLAMASIISAVSIF